MSYLTTFLEDEELFRLVARHPKLALNSEEYCPTCDKTGSFTWKGTTFSCDCYSQLQRHKHYHNAGIGVTYQRLSWDDFEGTIPSEVVRFQENPKLYINRGIGLLLWGQNGTGKTMLATQELKELVLAGYRCYSSTFSNMVEMYTAGWRSESDKAWFARKIIDIDVLLLDDLGREFRSAAKLAETTFDNILRTRVQEGRTTFLTTNMSPGELANGYGAGALSLLTEVCMEVAFRGDNFRQRAHDRAQDELARGELRPIF